MPGRPGRIQASFVTGEIADTLEARKDLKYYRSGLRQAVNGIPLPQGPLTLRPYTRQIGRTRHLLTAVSLAGATITAPAGGTPANAADADPATRVVTGAISGAGPHVVLHVDFHAPKTVAAVDAAPFKAAAAGRISVEYWDGAAWQVLNGDRALRTADRSRRFCAPPTRPVTANVWRVVVRNLAGLGAVELGGIAFFAESAAYGPSRLRSFGYSREEAYDLVLMAGHGDVYAAGGGWLTGFALPHTGDELARGRWRQQLNTGLVFCASRAPVRVFRENADLEWQVGLAPLKALPDHDYGDTDYTNGVPAIWDLEFVNWPAFTGLFTMTVDGEETDGISQNTGEDLPAKIKDALERLPNISPGVTVTSSGWTTRRITFSGEGNEGQVVVNSTRVLNKSDAAVAWIRIQKGKKGGEPVFSDARGWPRVGAFYQQRLILGGAPGVPNAFLASVTGEFYNMQTELSTANGAMLVPMDTEGAEYIEEILPSRALLIFTSEGEYWIANTVLTKEQAPNPIKASAFGIREGVPVVEHAGGAIFAGKEGSTLLEFRFNEVDQTFTTTHLSVLATHLVRDVADLALRRASTDTDAALAYFVQDDGAMRVVALMREQEITGFGRIETDGTALAVCVNAKNEVTAHFERAVNGEPVRFLERFETGLLLDQAVSLTLDPPAAVVTGLVDHEGAEVWALADGEVHGPYTVAGGVITLPQPAAAVTVGRWQPFLAETLPPNREVGPAIVTESPVGYHTVRVALKDTTSVAIGGQGEGPFDVPLLDFGGVPDVPSTQNLFTGKREVAGFAGAEDDPTVVVTQLRPGFITLLSVTPEGDF